MSASAMEALYFQSLKSAMAKNSSVAFSNFAQLATIDTQVLFLLPSQQLVRSGLWKPQTHRTGLPRLPNGLREGLR